MDIQQKISDLLKNWKHGKIPNTSFPFENKNEAIESIPKDFPKTGRHQFWEIGDLLGEVSSKIKEIETNYYWIGSFLKRTVQSRHWKIGETGLILGLNYFFKPNGFESFVFLLQTPSGLQMSSLDRLVVYELPLQTATLSSLVLELCHTLYEFLTSVDQALTSVGRVKSWNSDWASMKNQVSKESYFEKAKKEFAVQIKKSELGGGKDFDNLINFFLADETLKTFIKVYACKKYANKIIYSFSLEPLGKRFSLSQINKNMSKDILLLETWNPKATLKWDLPLEDPLEIVCSKILILLTSLIGSSNRESSHEFKRREISRT